MSGTLPEWAKRKKLHHGHSPKRLAAAIVSAMDISEVAELVGELVGDSEDDILDYLWCYSIDETPEQIAEQVQAWRESIVERAESAAAEIINRSEAA